MNDAHISAQIETLQMALDRIFNDCDKMQIELGRLKAGMAPCKHYNEVSLTMRDEGIRRYDCPDCGRTRTQVLPVADLPAVEPWQTDDVQPVTGGRPIKCVSCGEAVAAWDDTGNRGWHCLTCRTAYEETGRSL